MIQMHVKSYTWVKEYKLNCFWELINDKVLALTISLHP